MGKPGKVMTLWNRWSWSAHSHSQIANAKTKSLTGARLRLLAHAKRDTTKGTMGPIAKKMPDPETPTRHELKSKDLSQNGYRAIEGIITAQWGASVEVGMLRGAGDSLS